MPCENQQNNKKKNMSKKNKRTLEGPVRIDVNEIEGQIFKKLRELVGETVLIITESDQLDLFDKSFRPIFCGTIFAVEQSQLTLFPVNIKMVSAPFFEFPTPLSIPLEKIAHFIPNFDCDTKIPLT
ncbi:hypothetical protein [Priestia filamentosa]|uniref:hypothetical protein n=1 Tax=Priestia filamentosa TaxID=1402861 RepID=UPI0039790E6E